MKKYKDFVKEDIDSNIEKSVKAMSKFGIIPKVNYVLVKINPNFEPRLVGFSNNFSLEKYVKSSEYYESKKYYNTLKNEEGNNLYSYSFKDDVWFGFVVSDDSEIRINEDHEFEIIHDPLNKKYYESL